MRRIPVIQKYLLRLAFVLLLIAILASALDITITQASNTYLTSKSYSEVYVLPGESVWSIASKYVTNKDDIRELIFAIRQINGLSTKAEIQPGQVLKIPTKSTERPLGESTLAKTR